MNTRTWAVRVASAVVLVCAVSLGASAQQNPSLPAHVLPPPLIVPGRSIGQWSLDTRVQDLVGQFEAEFPLNLSAPSPEFRKNLWYHEWNSNDIGPQAHSTNPNLIALTPLGSVFLAALGTPDHLYQTPEHIAVGATPSQITAAYKDPQITLRPAVGAEFLIYNDLGIAFELAYDALAKGYPFVERVYVFRVGQAATVWVLP